MNNYRSQSTYLKELKIERNYLSKFIFWKASSTLQKEMFYALKCLDSEIERVEKNIQEYKEKIKKQQVTIYEIL